MFSVNRWAALFLSVTGDNAESAFSCLKLIAAPVKSSYIVFSGYTDSIRLEKILRESFAAAGGANGAAKAAVAVDEAATAAEYAIRYLCLLVKRKYLKKIDFLLERIEQMLNEQKGILNITLETANQSGAYEAELLDMIREKTGAAGIKAKTITRPELLGGYVLRMGSSYIDASLKGQMEKMKSELERTALAASDKAVFSGGINV